jgi:NADH-quinone oxidoreductase subunit L
MLVGINIMSAFLYFYTLIYMSEYLEFTRCFSSLWFFNFFVLSLVITYNYFQLFVGFEGVILYGALLKGFCYKRLQAFKSALQVFVMDKVDQLKIIWWLLKNLKICKCITS